jgi:hypothetical protein
MGGATVVNDLVFTATIDGRIVALDRTSGEERWSYQAPGGINAWPAVAGDTIIIPVGLTSQPRLIAFRIPELNALPGDYTTDGTVDAADYVVWRKGLGTIYTQADYDVWRSNFGKTAGSGAVDPLSLWSASAQPLSADVPEPSAFAAAVLFLAVSFYHLLRRPPSAKMDCEPPFAKLNTTPDMPTLAGHHPRDGPPAAVRLLPSSEALPAAILKPAIVVVFWTE